MRIPIPFNGGTTESQSVVINNQKAVNYYPAQESPGAKSPVTLRPTPGLKKLFSASLGPGRSNGIVFQNKMYFVSHDKLIESTSDLSSGTEIGTLNTIGGRVVMAASPTELILVDGEYGYHWDGTTFSVISDPDFPTATHIAWLDFYFIANDVGTGQFYKSGLNDGLSWNPLDFATAESQPDKLLAVYTTNNELWLLGEYTTEVYYNSGNPDFPFEQIPHGVLDIGIQAPYSIAQNQSGELVWLASSKHGANDVVKARVGGFQIISDADTGWVLEGLQTNGNLNICQSIFGSSDAYAWIYTQAAHTFYVITFPKNDITKVYDFRENFWHDRKSYQLGRHRASGYVFFNRKHVIFDYDNASVYHWCLETRDDDGAPIERIRRGMIVHKDRKDIFVSRFELEFEPGQGLVNGQGDNPQVMLRYTRNGSIWSHELWRPIGKIGEYNARSVWDSLGSGRQLQFESVITDPVKPILVGAYIDIEEGYH